jgi:predicted peptidase
MKKYFLPLIAVGINLLVGCGQSNSNQIADRKALQPGQHSAVLSREVLFEMDYLIFLPQDYGNEHKKWPLMVFLHGAGERGDNLNKVKVHGPPKLAEQGKNFPFIIVSPQCPADQWWPNRVEYVMALINETVESYSVDESRIYLTGLSMGGYGTWAIASTYPERFAAIAPVCGGGLPYLARNLKDLPIWAFHGAKDPVVPLEQSQQMVDAVKWAGGNARLTVYPEADHDSWTETYNSDELYEWLLSHSKKQE